MNTNILMANMIAVYYEKNNILPFTVNDCDDSDTLSCDVQEDFILEFKKHSDRDFAEALNEFILVSLEAACKGIHDTEN